MQNILIFSGTSEGRELARRLAVPRTTEEMLRIFNEAAWLKSRTDEFTAG